MSTFPKIVVWGLACMCLTALSDAKGPVSNQVKVEAEFIDAVAGGANSFRMNRERYVCILDPRSYRITFYEGITGNTRRVGSYVDGEEPTETVYVSGKEVSTHPKGVGHFTGVLTPDLVKNYPKAASLGDDYILGIRCDSL
jgi:hypothetical protein